MRNSMASALHWANVVDATRLGSRSTSTLRAVIEAGKPYCDISFMPEDALELDSLAVLPEPGQPHDQLVLAGGQLAGDVLVGARALGTDLVDPVRRDRVDAA